MVIIKTIEKEKNKNIFSEKNFFKINFILKRINDNRQVIITIIKLLLSLSGKKKWTIKDIKVKKKIPKNPISPRLIEIISLLKKKYDNEIPAKKTIIINKEKNKLNSNIF